MPRGIYARPTPAERLAARSLLTENGCLVWTGYLDRDGYGSFAVEGRTVRTHRWAYEHNVGPIPAGMVIDHLCRNRACVNFSHLEVVTVSENTLRGIAPTALNALKDQCKRGHALSGYNLVAVPGGRACRTCRVEATRQWRAKNQKKAA